MGVSGLQSFIEYSCRSAHENVDIKKLVEEYKTRTGKEADLLIDLASCLIHVYQKSSLNTNFLCGGQLKEFADVFVDILKNFDQLGCKCIIFVDSTPPINRIPLWMIRRKQTYDDVNKILNLVNCGNYLEAEDSARYVRPPCIMMFLLARLRAENVRVIKTVREADEEIMEYISAHGGCFGVLAQDSDFVIAEGVNNYLSMQHFTLQNMRTKVYKRHGLASDLRLRPDQLPLLATLNGNDIIDPTMLKDFHLRLLQDFKNFEELRTRKFLPRHFLLPRIAQWIRQNVKQSSGGPKWAENVAFLIRKPDLAPLISRSIQSYQLPEPRRLEPLMRNTVNGNSWDDTIAFSEYLLINKNLAADIHSVLTRLIKFGTVNVQFYDDRSFPNSGILLQTLRRKLYGILLKDRPKADVATQMTEYLFLGPTYNCPQLVTPIYPDAHPGLLNLWKDTYPVDAKWQLLCWAVSKQVSVSCVQDLPGPLQVPALALFYIIHEKKTFTVGNNSGEEEVLMKRWEDWQVNALIVQAVRLMNITVEDLRRIDCLAKHAEAIHLGTVYQYTCDQIYTVAQACGNPTALHLYPDFAFYDGKLFHTTYMALESGSDVKDLCTEQELHTYTAVSNFLFKCDVSEGEISESIIKTL